MRALSPLLLALFVAAPAMAADSLPGDRPSTDRDASTNFNRLGVKSLNADRMTLRGSGSTGDVSAMSVTPSAGAADATLAKRLHTPTFGGPVTAPSLTLSGVGSTGDVSGIAVTAGGATRNLAAWFPLLAPLASPSFSGTVTAPTLALTAPGSTGDASLMTVAPKLGPPAGSLDTLLSAVPVPFSKYGAGGKPGVDATAAFAAIRADTTSPTVSLPPGQYEISACPANPYFQSSVNLVGAGRGKTTIKFTGPSCTGNLFGWGGGLSDFGMRDLTIDWNGAPCTASNGVCSSLYITNNTRARIENVDFVGYTGENWFGVQVIGSSNGVFRGNRIQPQDCNVQWRSNLGLIFGGYTLASSRTGAIAGNVLTVTDKQYGSDIKVGQAVTAALACRATSTSPRSERARATTAPTSSTRPCRVRSQAARSTPPRRSAGRLRTTRSSTRSSTTTPRC